MRKYDNFKRENIEDILSNYANIDLVVCVGERNLQNIVLNSK